MLVILLTASATILDQFPNLLLSIIGLIGAFITAIAWFKTSAKSKLDIVKQTGFNLEKIEEMSNLSADLKKDLEDVKTILNNLKNKQEIDNEYLSKLLDKLEQSFNYYRDLITKQMK